jgi:hypothetical protein
MSKSSIADEYAVSTYQLFELRTFAIRLQIARSSAPQVRNDSILPDLFNVNVKLEAGCGHTDSQGVAL